MTDTVTRTDDVLQSAVIDELEWDPSVNATHIGVEVTDGAVTLSGESDTLAAYRAVQYTRGIASVISKITIRATVAPFGVQKSIGAALVRNARLDSENISVGADGDGLVTLTGTVNSWAESRQAEQVAWSAPGVTGITNRLVVAP